MSSASGAREGGDVLAWLVRVSRSLPPADLGDAVVEALGRLGARSSAVFLADRDLMSLHPLAPRAAGLDSFEVDGSIGGRAYSLERIVSSPIDGGTRLWIPLLDGTARLGVVSVDLDDDAARDDHLREHIDALVALAAELIVAKHPLTDVIEVARRRREMSLEAELQRCNLPPVALATPQVVVAGILLPAYEVAGDSFDYALNVDALDVAVIDSVGHELQSSVISHLVQGSLRNSRRNRVDLPEAYARADAAVAEVFPDVQFATAAFGRLDVTSGRFRWVSAGHPPPLIVKAGKVAGTAPSVPVLPIGLGGQDPVVNEVVLDPGDALLLYTDGATEGGPRGAERFGLDRLADLLERHLLDELPPPETLRRLVTAVLHHSAYELRDDTTLLLVCRPAASDTPTGP